MCEKCSIYHSDYDPAQLASPNLCLCTCTDMIYWGSIYPFVWLSNLPSDVIAQIDNDSNWISHLTQMLYSAFRDSHQCMLAETWVTMSQSWHQIGLWCWECSAAALILNTSEHLWGSLQPSYDHQWSLSGLRRNFVSNGKIVGMPQNCLKTLQRLLFILNLCVYFAPYKVIVRAFCQIMSHLSLFCLLIGAICPFALYEDNTKETISCMIVLGKQHNLWIPPSVCRPVNIVLE